MTSARKTSQIAQFASERGLKRTDFQAEGIGGKGLNLKAGMKADLVLFDAARVIDRSTFQDPGQIAEGIERVFVAGL